jgi:AcrR family transcriptional regulator
MAGEPSTASTQAPPRGTRPPNRRRLILDAAGRLFAERGYRDVSMGDIADAVAVRPSALYRHFPGKQELLREVVLTSFRAVHAALDQAAPDAGGGAMWESARITLDHRELGVLWQHEARHLGPEALRELRAELLRIAGLLAGHIRNRRPDLAPEQAELLAWAVFSALDSVSFHRIELPREHYDRLLLDIVARIVDADLAECSPGRPVVNPMPSRPAVTRRDQLVEHATRLFADRSYRGAGIEQIAAAAGIAGPSIYHHFASKAELMTAVLQPGADFLHEHLRRTLAATDDPAGALDELLRTYVEFGLTNPHLLELLINEVGRKPGEWRAVRRVERDYVAKWVELVRAVHPRLSDDDARVRVQAAMNIVNDLARSPRLAGTPGLADVLHTVGAVVVELPRPNTPA